MQQCFLYLRTEGGTGVLTDDRNRIRLLHPVFPMGTSMELVLTLFKNSTGTAVWTAAEVAHASWELTVNDGFGSPSSVKFRQSSGITTDTAGHIRIQLGSTATAELSAFLGDARQKHMTCELCGFASGSAVPSLILQWDIIMKNRISGPGTGVPAQVSDGIYTSAQTDALLAALPRAPQLEVLSAGSFAPEHGHVYRITLQQGMSINFLTTHFTTGTLAEFELWVETSSVPSASPFPSGLVWQNGSAPALQETGRYVFRFRWTGSQIRGQLLYRETLS